VLIAIILGPWAAVIAISIALLIQTLFFGDGGTLAFGANAFNMAFVMPFVGYGVYQMLTRNVALTSRRRPRSCSDGCCFYQVAIASRDFTRSKRRVAVAS